MMVPCGQKQNIPFLQLERKTVLKDLPASLADANEVVLVHDPVGMQGGFRVKIIIGGADFPPCFQFKQRQTTAPFFTKSYMWYSILSMV